MHSLMGIGKRFNCGSIRPNADGDKGGQLISFIIWVFIGPHETTSQPGWQTSKYRRSRDTAEY